MPRKPELPITGPTRLPPGRKRDEYEDAALEVYDKERWRKYQRSRRKRLKHNGTVERSFAIDAAIDTSLGELAKQAGTTKSRMLERLVRAELARLITPEEIHE